MKNKPIIILAIVVILAAAAILPFAFKEATMELPWDEILSWDDEKTTDPTGTTEIATDAPTEAPTEPQPQTFTLSFVGDCTLGCIEDYRALEYGFIETVGDDLDYPLANVRHIFEADDFTIANLEGPLTEEGTPAEKEFVFRGPTAYTGILSGSSVEAVTTANNHSWDWGALGQKNTYEALEAAGISYGARDGSFLHTTESGLVIGVYCDDFAFEKTHIRESIAALREAGAEVVICAFHWGEEKSYKPNLDQTLWAHIAIDAGADIVYGHHPHVLQPIEYYGDGVIFYSLANFCYGGSMNPFDRDTAILQQQIIRDTDGTISLGDTIAIPCSVTSASDRNNYQPTILEEGSNAFNRVLSKLDGTY